MVVYFNHGEDCVSCESLVSVHYALVQPYFDYCCLVASTNQCTTDFEAGN